MCNDFRKKHQETLLTDDKYRSHGETLDFPLDKVFDELQAAQCCRTEVITKCDMIAEIYGLPGMDKK